MPLSKIKGLGGKLGARLEELGAATAGQVAGMSWQDLLTHFQEKARYGQESEAHVAAHW